ncbi:hypothetical protein BDZ89DRAFT_1146932 [Hymenopellis radicata]|nr:hypothetical protein BDZ89DRAFT_1146932 [Hymenopellis radicata]
MAALGKKWECKHNSIAEATADTDARVNNLEDAHSKTQETQDQLKYDLAEARKESANGIIVAQSLAEQRNRQMYAEMKVYVDGVAGELSVDINRLWSAYAYANSDSRPTSGSSSDTNGIALGEEMGMAGWATIPTNDSCEFNRPTISRLETELSNDAEEEVESAPDVTVARRSINEVGHSDVQVSADASASIKEAMPGNVQDMNSTDQEDLSHLQDSGQDATCSSELETAGDGEAVTFTDNTLEQLQDMVDEDLGALADNAVEPPHDQAIKPSSICKEPALSPHDKLALLRDTTPSPVTVSSAKDQGVPGLSPSASNNEPAFSAKGLRAPSTEDLGTRTTQEESSTDNEPRQKAGAHTDERHSAFIDVGKDSGSKQGFRNLEEQMSSAQSISQALEQSKDSSKLLQLEESVTPADVSAPNKQVLDTSVRHYFKRVALEDVPFEFRILYQRHVHSPTCMRLINEHISSFPVPTEPSTSFTVEADLAWQSLFHVQQLFYPGSNPQIHAPLPCLFSWCLYFLEAIPWESLDTVQWPELDLPFTLLPCLVYAHTSIYPVSNSLPMYDIISAMLKISVKVALLLRRDSSGVYNRLERVFRVLNSCYPEDVIDDTMADATKDVTDAQVKELVSRLAIYVTSKPHDLPIDHVVHLVARLSERSRRIHDLCLKLGAPRWAAHTFRVATSLLRTRDDLTTSYAIEAAATYLSWLFVTELRTDKVVHIALSRRVLPGLFRCLTHEPRRWTSREDALPIATLLKYLATRIVACPTTQRKAKAALSQLETSQEQSLDERRLKSQLSPEDVSGDKKRGDETYAALWSRWEWLVKAIKDVDTGEERCANPECLYLVRTQVVIVSSFEGKVGKRFQDLKLFVIIAPPPFGTRTIHMYSDFPFGLDDPLNTAQIFDYTVGHLALISSSDSLQSANNSGRWLFSIMPSEV